MSRWLLLTLLPLACAVAPAAPYATPEIPAIGATGPVVEPIRYSTEDRWVCALRHVSTDPARCPDSLRPR